MLSIRVRRNRIMKNQLAFAAATASISLLLHGCSDEGEEGGNNGGGNNKPGATTMCGDVGFYASTTNPVGGNLCDVTENGKVGQTGRWTLSDDESECTCDSGGVDTLPPPSSGPPSGGNPPGGNPPGGNPPGGDPPTGNCTPMTDNCLTCSTENADICATCQTDPVKGNVYRLLGSGCVAGTCLDDDQCATCSDPDMCEACLDESTHSVNEQGVCEPIPLGLCETGSNDGDCSACSADLFECEACVDYRHYKPVLDGCVVGTCFPTTGVEEGDCENCFDPDTCDSCVGNYRPNSAGVCEEIVDCPALTGEQHCYECTDTENGSYSHTCTECDDGQQERSNIGWVLTTSNHCVACNSECHDLSDEGLSVNQRHGCNVCTLNVQTGEKMTHGGCEECADGWIEYSGRCVLEGGYNPEASD